MTGREIVKDIMNKQGKTSADMADSLGITQAAIWDRLNELNKKKEVKDIVVGTLSDMLRVLGYKIYILPRNFRVPDDGYKVE